MINPGRKGGHRDFVSCGNILVLHHLSVVSLLYKSNRFESIYYSFYFEFTRIGNKFVNFEKKNFRDGELDLFF